jgi:ATP synthase protein I
MRKLLSIQVLTTVVIALLSVWLGGRGMFVAAVFGGAIAVMNTLLLGRRVRRAAQATSQDHSRGVFALYLGAVERFVFTLAAFAVGMGLLHLPPEPLLGTFAAAQLGYWVAARGSGSKPV